MVIVDIMQAFDKDKNLLHFSTVVALAKALYCFCQTKVIVLWHRNTGIIKGTQTAFSCNN